MRVITIQQLRDLISAEQLHALRINVEANGYSLHVISSWDKTHPQPLMSIRGDKPRVWARLDSLIKFLTNEGIKKPFSLSLNLAARKSNEQI
jgi:hypothetical protein